MSTIKRLMEEIESYGKKTCDDCQEIFWCDGEVVLKPAEGDMTEDIFGSDDVITYKDKIKDKGIECPGCGYINEFKECAVCGESITYDEEVSVNNDTLCPHCENLCSKD
jgi:DNA-directed RNA polymerase subunit RPC12/RpoP